MYLAEFFQLLERWTEKPMPSFLLKSRPQMEEERQVMTHFKSKSNHDIYPGSSTHREVVFREVLHPDRIGIWKCWNLEMSGRVENQQQTQPTYDVESGNRTRATLVGGECFHHGANPAPLKACSGPKSYSIIIIAEQSLKSYNKCRYCTRPQNVPLLFCDETKFLPPTS